MPLSMRLKEYLDREGVTYQHHVHPLAYTSQEVAEVAHIPGREMAKSVILKAGEGLVVAVLAATDTAGLDLLRKEVGGPEMRLASEDEFRDAFPTCVVGAMPPFGNLFGLPTYCDAALQGNAEIEFNAGTHHDTIRMAFADFIRLVKPTIVTFAQR